MRKRISQYGQYKDDFFNKLDFNFEKGKKILDVGCGDGSDAKIFINEFGLTVDGIDIYEHENIKNIRGFKFKKSGIFDIPYDDGSFDYVFVHDVLHHIDEPKQRREKHIRGLRELRRVCKKEGFVIIVEANRYNFLFYPHMTLMKRHEHFKQSYFVDIIKKVFRNDSVQFKFFEVHLYPKSLLFLFKIYERIMENFAPRQFLAYNAALIKKL